LAAVLSRAVQFSRRLRAAAAVGTYVQTARAVRTEPSPSYFVITKLRLE
jgi:hypothetical protein